MDAGLRSLRRVQEGEDAGERESRIGDDQQVARRVSFALVAPLTKTRSQTLADEQGPRLAGQSLITVAGMIQEREVARTGGFQRPDRLDLPVRISFHPSTDQPGEVRQPVWHHPVDYLPALGAPSNRWMIWLVMSIASSA
jgi:hypothetical protein